MLRLEKITGKNVWELLELRVEEDQRGFVASNEVSVIEAYIALTRGGHACPFGLYDGDRAVGFVMIGYGTDEDWEEPPEIAKNNYSLWRLMIDRRYQRRGYGRAAVGLALDFIRTMPCGQAAWCWVSYMPENTAARRLYRSFGFRENGERDGEELIALLRL